MFQKIEPWSTAARTAQFALLVVGGVLCGCSGDSDDPTPDILYSHARNASSQIAPILSVSGTGFDAAEVDSAAVVIDRDRPLNDYFLLLYEATSGTNVLTIGVVSSNEEDFETLTVPRTLAVDVGAPGSGFEFAATDPTVVVDPLVPFGTVGHYLMWFEGRSGALGAVSTIISCSSADGVTWSGFTPCTGLTPSFGSVRVADPTVVLAGGMFMMWFEAIDSTLPSGADGPGSIGYAVATNATGTDWLVTDAAGNTGSAATPVFMPGSPGTYDAYSVNAPSVLLDATLPVGNLRRYRMWYEAGDVAGPTESTIGFTFSADGLTWTHRPMPVWEPSSDSITPLPFDSGDVKHPSAAIESSIPANTDGHYLLWYSGDGENNANPNRIGLATGRDP